jgi:hypothetical protein
LFSTIGALTSISPTQRRNSQERLRKNSRNSFKNQISGIPQDSFGAVNTSGSETLSPNNISFKMESIKELIRDTVNQERDIFNDEFNYRIDRKIDLLSQ